MVLGETCSRYGKFPHEIAALPAAERTFVFAETAKRLEERSDAAGEIKSGTGAQHGW